MKLIPILTLLIAMTTMAAAQNSSGANANSGGQKPVSNATPTPGAMKANPGTAAAGTRSPAAGAKAPATGAKAPTANPVPTPSARKNAATSPGTGGKPAGTVVSTTKGGAVKSAPAQGVPAPAATSANPTKTGGSVAGSKTGVSTPARKKTAAVPVKTGRRKARPAKPLVAKVPKPEAKPASKPEAPAAVVAAKPRIGALGRRDPFVSPIRTSGPSGPGANCNGGKRCLSIPELVLAGTVKDISGKMMAVVVTGNKKTYTLRENDQVFNGTVEKITSDSVIFREFFKDAVGRESAREVVKKMNPGPVT